jgi:hypothetical protein
MLPAQYQLPAALVLLLSGIVACFFGYRLFRIVLSVSGFILGAALASSLFGASDTMPMVIAAIVGGLIGAGVLFAAYFVGVALVGAVGGALLANLAFRMGAGEPHFLVIVFASVLGAVASIYLQRYVIIFGTSFGGAWTLIHGALAVLGNEAALEAATESPVWVLYPLDPAPGQQWVPIAWVILGLIGIGVQSGVTGGEKGRVRRRKKRKDASES